MANEKIYLHEFVDIILQNRTKYVHHMTANWGPVGRRAQDALLRRLGHGGQH